MARQYAGIRLRSDGRYEKRFTVNGCRYSVFGSTRKECMDNELIRRKEIEEHKYIKNRSVTMNQYFNEWIAVKEQEVKETTVRLFNAVYKNQIKPYLGTRKIKDLERRELALFQAKIIKKYSISTTKKAMNTIHQMLESAVIDEIIAVNVANSLPKIRKKATEREARETIHRALTEKEVSTFLEYAKKDWNYNAMRLLLATGIRAGECGALYWRDIDYKNNVIHIKRTITKDKENRNIIGTTTKTKKSTRDIPLNDEIKRILEEQREFMHSWQGANVIEMNDRVFKSENGGLVYAGTLNNSIEKILIKMKKDGIEIKHFSPHAFRSTFASLAVRKGMPLNVLKEIMGHTSYAMTADLYGHVYNEQKQEAMNLIKII